MSLDLIVDTHSYISSAHTLNFRIGWKQYKEFVEKFERFSKLIGGISRKNINGYKKYIEKIYNRVNGAKHSKILKDLELPGDSIFYGTRNKDVCFLRWI